MDCCVARLLAGNADVIGLLFRFGRPDFDDIRKPLKTMNHLRYRGAEKSGKSGRHLRFSRL
jgi:hypothetical protein